ncbi:MAG: zinc ribbon domain-containing protein [Myxococcales bacterium]|nr:zinc ribbon domain-containing protein [Myxococcales bacterium]
MPIYEYECQKCKKHFEYTQGIKEPKKETCEECAGSLERLISASGFVLKGGGWYKDLYSSSKKPESKTETKTEAKTEAKPDKKKE